MFDKKAYQDRRYNGEVCDEDKTKGYLILCYLICSKEDGNKTLGGQYREREEAQKAFDALSKSDQKKHYIRVLIHKPLSGRQPKKIIEKTPGDKHFATGETMVQMPGKGIIKVNRSQARRRSPNRDGSKPLKRRSAEDRKADRLISLGKKPASKRPPFEFRHTVNKHSKRTIEQLKPRKRHHAYPPEMTNKERHEYRADLRKRDAEIKREAKMKSEAATNGS